MKYLSLLILLSICSRAICGTIAGTVVDSESGIPVESAHVSLEGLGFMALTDIDGQFILDNVPVGEYKALVTHVSYDKERFSLISAPEGGEHAVIRMKPVVYDLPEVVVEAKGMGGKVYDNEKIRHFQADNLGEFLNSTGELTILDGGGAQSAVISIRGSKSGQTAFYLDGRLLNDPVTGDVDLKSIPLGNIEEITINPNGDYSKSGAGSGGVVELKTGEITGAGLKTGYGSYGWRTIGAELGKKQGIHNLSLSIDRTDYSGNFKYENAEGEERIRLNDDYSNNNYFVKYSGERENSQWDASFNHYSSDRGAPGSIENPATMDRIIRRNSVISAHYNRSGENWVQQVRADFSQSYNQNLSYSFFNGDTLDFPSSYKVNSAEFDARSIKADANGQFTGGINSRVDRVNGSSLADPEDRQNAGVFLGRTEVWKNLRVSSIVRGDGYKDYGTFLSSSLNGRLNTGRNRDKAITFNWSKGVNLPTFNDLFYAENAFAAPNPDLKPERVESWDAGMEMDKKTLNLKATFYQKRIKDLIVWQESFTNTGKKWKPFNTNSAVIKGIELFGRLDFDRWGIQGSSNFANPRNESPGYEGNYLVFQPILQSTESFYLNIGRYKTTFSHRYLSRRYILQANTKWAEAASLYDLAISGRWKISGWNLEGAFRVENMTDEEYYIIRNSPMPGRSYKISFNFQQN